MSVESFSYSLLTALFGMGTVTFFLVLLSGLMVVIRRLFDTPAEGAPTVKKGKTGNGVAETQGSEIQSGADVVDASGVPRWVIAGVLAYIAAEETAYTPYSRVWIERGRQ
ncbi:MAG: OadG family protein [Alkalispirochaeta sp.]